MPNSTIRSIPLQYPWSPHLQPASSPRQVLPLKEETCYHATASLPMKPRKSRTCRRKVYGPSRKEFELIGGELPYSNDTEPCCTSVTWPPHLLRTHEATIPRVEALGGTDSAEYGPRSSNQIFSCLMHFSYVYYQMQATTLIKPLSYAVWLKLSAVRCSAVAPEYTRSGRYYYSGIQKLEFLPPSTNLV